MSQRYTRNKSNFERTKIPYRFILFYSDKLLLKQTFPKHKYVCMYSYVHAFIKLTVCVTIPQHILRRKLVRVFLVWNRKCHWLYFIDIVLNIQKKKKRNINLTADGITENLSLALHVAAEVEK